MEEPGQNGQDQTGNRETLDRILDAVITTDSPVVTMDDIAAALDESPETARHKLIELHTQGRVERVNIYDSEVDWWAPRPLDVVLKTLDIETLLKRLSDELETPITLGDGTIYENGDKHTTRKLDSKTQSETETHSTDKNTAGLVPSSEKSGEKRQQLKDGADFDDVSE
ncbi:hypothetical protein [Haladaptatus halobius]|uniref:hypothetical protein n=1 Tax=Haladaptatus halobius TaxID=2884875 RepID=UPI001D0B0674|nr:hypothetical protein [Haladaptatus halobius]